MGSGIFWFENMGFLVFFLEKGAEGLDGFCREGLRAAVTHDADSGLWVWGWGCGHWLSAWRFQGFRALGVSGLT